MRIKDDDFLEFFREDMSNVGTADYKGYGYFWARKYKIDLRETTPNIRRQIHKQFLKEGLVLHGETARHDDIVNKKVRTKEHRRRMEKCYGSGSPSIYTQQKLMYEEEA